MENDNEKTHGHITSYLFLRNPEKIVVPKFPRT